MSATMNPAGGGIPAPPPGGVQPTPGLPPGLAAPRPNVGATQGQANAGNLGAAMLDIKNGLQFFQRALPNIPMGSPLWNEIHSVIGRVAKHAADEGPQSLLNQSAMALIRDRSQNPQSAAVGKMFPAAGGAGAAPAPPTPSAEAA